MNDADGHSRWSAEPPAARPSRGWTWTGALAIGVIMLIQTSWFAGTKSATYDETFYLACARQTLNDGRLDPRLARGGVAPLPVVACHLPAALGWGQPRAVAHQGQLDDPPLIRRARFISVAIVGIPLVLAVYLWLVTRQGIAVGIAGAGLLVFSPTIVAHASLAATDAAACLSALVALFALAAYARRGSPWRLVTAGAAAGVAFAVKYSAVFLGPVAAVVLVVVAIRGARVRGWVERVSTFAADACVYYAVLFVVTWLCHGLAMSAPPDKVSALPIVRENEMVRWCLLPEAPAPLVGVMVQIANHHRGHPAFLMGRHSTDGWRDYYAWALWLKSTPAECLVFALVVVAFFMDVFGRSVGGGDRWIFYIAVIVISASLAMARINIGQRYALCLYPLAVLIVVERWGPVMRRHSCQAVVAVLVVVQCASIMSIAPHYLSYFSPLAGGPSRGWLLLVDSNLDWGQDLPALKRSLDELNARRVLLCYFGTALPEAYGVTGDPARDDNVARLDRYDAIAVSATLLQGVATDSFGRRKYTVDQAFYARLRASSPIARAGHSIFVFDPKDLARD